MADNARAPGWDRGRKQRRCLIAVHWRQNFFDSMKDYKFIILGQQALVFARQLGISNFELKKANLLKGRDAKLPV